jgi:ferritin-like protein
MSSESLHEDAEKLGPVVTDQHRAIVSVMEELEAVDWYNQRAQATDDLQLRAILEHNRDEEKEHAAMVLEWLRRSDATLSRHLKTYLFTEGSITGIEVEAEHGAGADGHEAVSEDGSLGIGSLRMAKEQRGEQ